MMVTLAPVYELAWPFLRKLLSFRRLLAHNGYALKRIFHIVCCFPINMQ